MKLGRVCLLHDSWYHRKDYHERGAEEDRYINKFLLKFPLAILSTSHLVAVHHSLGNHNVLMYDRAK